MKPLRIAVLPGDGIGKEVIDAGLEVLRAAQSRIDGLLLDCDELPAGANCYLATGVALAESTFEECRRADAILLGAMGLPDVRLPGGTEITPQLDLRERLDLYAGVRPIRLYNTAHSPHRRARAGEIDLVFVRENTEGMFASRKAVWTREQAEVTDQLRVSRHASERLFRFAFRLARQRRSHVTLVDKSNVLPSMAFFRSIFDEVAREFSDVATARLYVDAAALYLVQRPQQFDVIVAENLMGDILSDLAAGLVGGMGMAPSGDIGDRHAMFQPAHGSAPDIAGRGIANPLAAILSVAMMLAWFESTPSRAAAALIRGAVERVTADAKLATPDLGGALTTRELTARVVESVQKTSTE